MSVKSVIHNNYIRILPTNFYEEFFFNVPINRIQVKETATNYLYTMKLHYF